MEIFTGVVLYLIIWWVLIFLVLPWGSRPPKQVEVGHSRGAPERPRLFLKFFLNSVLSAFVWWGIITLISKNILTLDALSFLDLTK